MATKAETGAGSVTAEARDRLIEQKIRKHQAENPGTWPTHLKVREMLGGGSLRDINDSMKRVKPAMEAIQTRLSALPETPEELRQQAAALAEAMWAFAKETANKEIADLRRAQDLRDEESRQGMASLEEALGEVETERDAEAERARAAEARVAQQAEAILGHLREIEALKVRLDERSAILAQLGRLGADVGVTVVPKARAPEMPKAGAKGRPKRPGDQADPGPVTPELPM